MGLFLFIIPAKSVFFSRKTATTHSIWLKASRKTAAEKFIFKRDKMRYLVK